MKKQKGFIYLKPQFIMKAEDVKFLESLPDNGPETHLTQKQKDQVSRLYYEYIGRPIDNQRAQRSLQDIEKSEKWPSGPRMKQHEAQRICLGFLVQDQRNNGMKPAKAIFHFFNELTLREAAQRMTAIIWEVKPIY